MDYSLFFYSGYSLREIYKYITRFFKVFSEESLHIYENGIANHLCDVFFDFDTEIETSIREFGAEEFDMEINRQLVISVSKSEPAEGIRLMFMLISSMLDNGYISENFALDDDVSATVILKKGAYTELKDSEYFHYPFELLKKELGHVRNQHR